MAEDARLWRDDFDDDCEECGWADCDGDCETDDDGDPWPYIVTEMAFAERGLL